MNAGKAPNDLPPPARALDSFPRIRTLAEYQAALERGLKVYLRDTRNDDEPGEEPQIFTQVWPRTGAERNARWKTLHAGLSLLATMPSMRRAVRASLGLHS